MLPLPFASGLAKVPLERFFLVLRGLRRVLRFLEESFLVLFLLERFRTVFLRGCAFFGGVTFFFRFSRSSFFVVCELVLAEETF